MPCSFRWNLAYADAHAEILWEKKKLFVRWKVVLKFSTFVVVCLSDTLTSINLAGPVELASAAVGMSVFNIISKLFNIPLLSITTSFVAEDVSKHDSSQSASGTDDYWFFCAYETCLILEFAS